jgi:hypothetical protein
MTLRTKVDRYAQLVNDCYLSVTLPDIYSGVVPLGTNPVPPGFNTLSQAIPYEFQWVRNLGYNMIASVSLMVNGQEIVHHTGEWMKLYANLQFDAHKRALLDTMVGNVPEMYDPATAHGGGYPTSLTSSTTPGQASIAGRILQIPLHFWFCESVGKALPLVALQYSDVEIVVELRNMYELFTTIDVNPVSASYGQRVAPDTSSSLFQMSKFLSPPTLDATSNSIPDLRTWNVNPYVEANYIFLTDEEGAYIARTDHSFIIKQVDVKEAGKLYGPGNDVELTMRNLCTRIVWVYQRDDRVNDPDNYTNWVDPETPPLVMGDLPGSSYASSGTLLGQNVSRSDILLEASVILDTQERFATKQAEFFRDIEPYRFTHGRPLPGVYHYSFQLDTSDQPSGTLNGSMFNKTILRSTLLTPPFTPGVLTGSSIVTTCVLKSSVGFPNPTVVNPNAKDRFGKLLYKPEDIITLVQKSPNFFRIIGGMGNVTFSS